MPVGCGHNSGSTATPFHFSNCPSHHTVFMLAVLPIILSSCLLSFLSFIFLILQGLLCLRMSPFFISLHLVQMLIYWISSKDQTLRRYISIFVCCMDPLVLKTGDLQMSRILTICIYLERDALDRSLHWEWLQSWLLSKVGFWKTWKCQCIWYTDQAVIILRIWKSSTLLFQNTNCLLHAWLTEFTGQIVLAKGCMTHRLQPWTCVCILMR